LIFFAKGIASSTFLMISSGSGLPRKTTSSGNTSLIPPTFVDTTTKPESAASV